MRDITFETEYGLTLPGRAHVYMEGPHRYSVTVIDYASAEKIHTDRSRACTGYPDTCGNRFRAEVRGALEYAAWTFIQRDAKVTHYASYNTDLVEGRRIQMLNPDKSQTFVAIHIHENRLYLLEGTVAAGSPPPGLFQQSLGFVDKDGNRIRYATVYDNDYPAPARTR